MFVITLIIAGAPSCLWLPFPMTNATFPPCVHTIVFTRTPAAASSWQNPETLVPCLPNAALMMTLIQMFPHCPGLMSPRDHQAFRGVMTCLPSSALRSGGPTIASTRLPWTGAGPRPTSLPHHHRAAVSALDPWPLPSRMHRLQPGRHCYPRSTPTARPPSSHPSRDAPDWGCRLESS